jgi:hypothetical protein
MLYFARYSAGICAAAILIGCNGFQPQLPVPEAQTQSRAQTSWMAPAAKSQNLLYIADLGTNSVDVYPYPKGKLVGTITGFGSVSTLCADKAGDIFVVDEAGPVRVYAHGGTAPIRQLAASGAPDGCAVDPVTGNLAVTNQSSYLYGTIAIYAKARGKAKPYFNDTVDATFFCSYDDMGNLFIDGWNRSAQPTFLELPKGKSGFRVMKINKNVQTPGGVQWDGKYVAVGDKGAGLVYRVDANGKVAQTIKLRGADDIDQFWLQGATLIGPNDHGGGPVGFWRFPAGGSPTHVLRGPLEPTGVTVSLAQ